MEIKKIYWREDALNNLKDILASYNRQKKKIVQKIIEDVAIGIDALKKRPYIGYIESSMSEQPQKIYSHYVNNRGIRVLYYTENEVLYIIDFWDA